MVRGHVEEAKREKLQVRGWKQCHHCRLRLRKELILRCLKCKEGVCYDCMDRLHSQSLDALARN